MAAAEKGKKKRAPLSSFTILLIILVVLAIVTVIMSACGVEGVQGATLSQVLTAPVFGFQDVPVRHDLGRLPRHRHRDRRA